MVTLLNVNCLPKGRGYPDVNTRLMLKKLWSRFRMPILALVDADPHGYHANNNNNNDVYVN